MVSFSTMMSFLLSCVHIVPVVEYVGVVLEYCVYLQRELCFADKGLERTRKDDRHSGTNFIQTVRNYYVTEIWERSALQDDEHAVCSSELSPLFHFSLPFFISFKALGKGRTMSTSGLKAIAPVPTATDFLDIVLSRTQRKTPTVRFFLACIPGVFTWMLISLLWCRTVLYLLGYDALGHPQKLQDQQDTKLLYAQGQVHAGYIRRKALGHPFGVPYARCA